MKAYHRNSEIAMKELEDFYNQNANIQYSTAYKPNLNTGPMIESFSGLPWLKLELPFWFPHKEMLQEAVNMNDSYVPHRTKETHSGWESLCIHGLASGMTNIHQQYYTKDTAPYDWNNPPYNWTDICKICPVTHAFFRDLFCYDAYARVRFMLLRPGGYILPHKDYPYDTLGPINIALNQPEGCDFVMEDRGVVPFVSGSAFLLSLSNRHIVWNRSNEDRYHIIVHGKRNQKMWNEIIKDSYNSNFPVLES